jgi:hypothetical protein
MDVTGEIGNKMKGSTATVVGPWHGAGIFPLRGVIFVQTFNDPPLASHKDNTYCHKITIVSWIPNSHIL